MITVDATGDLSPAGPAVTDDESEAGMLDIVKVSLTNDCGVLL